MAATVLASLAFAASAQDARFLSSNHCIYRIKEQKNYLLLPVQEKAEMCNIKVVKNNTQVKALNVRLASNHIDYYVPLDLKQFGEDAKLALDIHVNGTYRNDGELSGFTCWKNMQLLRHVRHRQPRKISPRLSPHTRMGMDERPQRHVLQGRRVAPLLPV